MDGNTVAAHVVGFIPKAALQQLITNLDAASADVQDPTASDVARLLETEYERWYGEPLTKPAE